MNKVYVAKEYDYDHDLILGVYDTFEQAENACKQYAKESDITYGDYCVIEIPMNRSATEEEVYYNDNRKFTKVKVYKEQECPGVGKCNDSGCPAHYAYE